MVKVFNQQPRIRGGGEGYLAPLCTQELLTDLFWGIFSVKRGHAGQNFDFDSHTPSQDIEKIRFFECQNRTSKTFLIGSEMYHE